MFMMMTTTATTKQNKMPLRNPKYINKYMIKHAILNNRITQTATITQKHLLTF